MKSFLFGFSKFTIPFIILLYILDGVISYGYHNTTDGDYGVWNKILNGKINTEILINGSSRALVHFDCNIIEKTTNKTCYNIGLDGSPINSQLHQIELYFRENKPPQYFIQVVDITLGGGKPFYSKPSQYIPYLHEDSIYNRLVDFEPEFFYYKYIPMYGYASYNNQIKYSLNYLIGSNTLIHNFNRIKGYRPTDAQWTSDFEHFKQNIDGKTVLGIGKSAIDTLSSVIMKAQKFNSIVILVYPPQYYEFANIASNKAELMAKYKEIANNNNCYFWDFTELELCKEKKYFYNSQHLNQTGASLFSEIFAQKLQTLMTER